MVKGRHTRGSGVEPLIAMAVLSARAVGCAHVIPKYSHSLAYRKAVNIHVFPKYTHPFKETLHTYIHNYIHTYIKKNKNTYYNT